MKQETETKKKTKQEKQLMKQETETNETGNWNKKKKHKTRQKLMKQETETNETGNWNNNNPPTPLGVSSACELIIHIIIIHCFHYGLTQTVCNYVSKRNLNKSNNTHELQQCSTHSSATHSSAVCGLDLGVEFRFLQVRR